MLSAEVQPEQEPVEPGSVVSIDVGGAPMETRIPQRALHCDFDRVDDKELHVMFEDEPEEEGILKQMFRSIFG